MTTKYFRKADGSYIGGFDVPAAMLPALLPPGAVEVPVAPEHAAQIWDGAKWGGAIPPAPKTAVEKLADVLVAKGVLQAGDVVAVKDAATVQPA